MTSVSIGDLAQSLQLRRDNARLNAQLNTLTRELSTGKTADPDTRLSGDYTVFAALNADLSRNASVQRAIRDFGLETDARQTTLGSVLDLGREVTTALLEVSTLLGPEARRAAAQTAASRFEGVVLSLNTQLGGRALFAGQAVGGAAVTSVETMLTDIEAQIATAGATDPADIETIVQQWFGPGGGFETIGYVGAPDPLSEPAKDGSFGGEVPTALDPRLRETLAGLALASLVDQGIVDPATDEAVDLLGRASAILLNADQDLVDMRAEIGNAQERNESQLAELTSAQFALEQARNSLTEVDTFKTAVELENAENQLRTLYALTAKLSGLSLTEFIR